MTVLKILNIPNPRLRNKAILVKKVDDEIRKFMDDLKETCKFHDGVGLASIQVGDPRSIIFINFDEESPGHCYYMANPRITWKSDKMIESKEGCLSVPDVFNTIMRHAEIKIDYLDYNNEMRSAHFKENMSRYIQHEVDHLEGILYIDHLSLLKRKILMKKYSKILAEKSFELE